MPVIGTQGDSTLSVAALNVAAVLFQPGAIARLASDGVEPGGDTSAEFLACISATRLSSGAMLLEAQVLDPIRR